MLVRVCIAPISLGPLYVCPTAGRPRCRPSRQFQEPPVQDKGPDISLLKPQLQKQWHHARNQRLGNIQIPPGSCRLVWWTCDQCPCGLPHEWLAQINNRQGMEQQCPFCTNRKVCRHNALLTVAPAVASCWDANKNGVTADQVLAGSSTRGYWLCPTCSYSWQAPVSSKVGSSSGCPKCSQGSRGYTRQPTLTASNHAVMVDFDHSRNQEAGLDPDKSTLGSAKQIHWICSNCPRGRPHMYQASPHNRVGGGRTGCPYCSKRKACVCNSLQSLYPALAAEWHTARNGVGPDQILPASTKLAYWKNAAGHSWEQSPNQRTLAQHSRTKRALHKAQLNKQQAYALPPCF